MKTNYKCCCFKCIDPNINIFTTISTLFLDKKSYYVHISFVENIQHLSITMHAEIIVYAIVEAKNAI